ncbi:MAG: hypothetical protein IMW89_07320 [Ktedonobacteraceae bacterium]|nr:hypothetical protein [Ktedonobacteraceae bacterium]
MQLLSVLLIWTAQVAGDNKPIYLFVVSELGRGKKVPVEQYPTQRASNCRIVTIERQEQDGVLLTLLVGDDDTLLLTWSDARGEQVTAMKAADIKTFPRSHRGIPLVEGRVKGIVRL